MPLHSYTTGKAGVGLRVHNHILWYLVYCRQRSAPTVYVCWLLVEFTPADPLSRPMSALGGHTRAAQVEVERRFRLAMQGVMVWA